MPPNKVIKKKCESCLRIDNHCHFEGRVYWLDPEQEEKEFTIYESTSPSN